MAIKSILVPVGGVKADRTTLDLALAVARKDNAHIEAMFARRDPAEALLYAGLGADPTSLRTIADQIAQDAGRMSENARRQYEDWRRERDVAETDRAAADTHVTSGFSESIGSGRECVMAAGRVVDLIVLGSGSPPEASRADLVLEGALFGTGRPVLIAPATPPKATFGTALIAWNGSLEATRAVTAAIPLLASCRQIFVLSEAEAHRPAAEPAALLGYLAWHGLKADRLSIYQRHGSLGGDLLGTAQRIGADILVMGAYTHTRLRELLLGGVTKHVVEHATMPVLMAH